MIAIIAVITVKLRSYIDNIILNNCDGQWSFSYISNMRQIQTYL